MAFILEAKELILLQRCKEG